MRVAFLDPLEARLSEYPSRYLSGHEVLLTTQPGSLPDRIEDADAVIWSSYPVDAALINRLPRLRFMQRIGLVRAKGDVTAAHNKGIPVSVTPHGVSDRVAQHAMALTLDVVKKITQSHLHLQAGRNPDNLPEAEAGGPAIALNWTRTPDVGTLNDKTVGIIGFGEIGACFTRLLLPFNCRVLYYKRTRLEPDFERYFGIEYASLDEVLSRSDVLQAFLPISEETRKMLSAREFGRMKPGSLFVNVGRGNTLDENALVDALRNGPIAFAGLDVFSVEPLPMSNPLRSLDNVVLTPHSAGGVFGMNNVFERIAENLRRVEAGEPIMFPLQPGDPQPS
ncbi:MAG TPA: NAD(P)-dependent oxidoreductase [Dehalococcoidia bacterium]|nr:NAD(P)-dependent oxidoreductase [Dehalococcoidia bacterium]